MSQQYDRGYPPPRQPGPPREVVQRIVVTDARGMVALRAITYVLVSLASIVFLLLATFGYVKYRQAQTALEQLGSLFGSSSSAVPGLAPTFAPIPTPPGN